jgi:anti-sigma factor RsiW
MNLHADVVRDLVSIYLAGEASVATRELVEREIARDPHLARIVHSAAREGAIVARAAAPPAPESGKRALDSTRRLLRRRSWLLAGAIFTSLLPFSAAGGSDGVRFFLLRDVPALAALSLAAAVGFWLLYARDSRRLRVTGL